MVRDKTGSSAPRRGNLLMRDRHPATSPSAQCRGFGPWPVWRDRRDQGRIHVGVRSVRVPRRARPAKYAFVAEHGRRGLMVMRRVITAILASMSIASCNEKAAKPVHSTSVGEPPDSFHVAFETTRGRFVVEAHHGWAP